MWHQIQFLMDHADAETLGSRGIGNVDGSAFELDDARVPTVDAAQDLHERGLARAVLAYESVNLSGQQLELAVGKSMNAGEILVDAEHFDDRLRQALLPGVSGACDGRTWSNTAGDGPARYPRHVNDTMTVVTVTGLSTGRREKQVLSA